MRSMYMPRYPEPRRGNDKSCLELPHLFREIYSILLGMKEGRTQNFETASKRRIMPLFNLFYEMYELPHNNFKVRNTTEPVCRHPSSPILGKKVSVRNLPGINVIEKWCSVQVFTWKCCTSWAASRVQFSLYNMFRSSVMDHSRSTVLQENEMSKVKN